MPTKLFHSIYSYASELGCDRPRKNLLEEIKNKIRKIDIFSAIYINIKVVPTTNSKIDLQRSLQNLILDFSTKKNLKSVKNSAQKMILNLVFLFYSTVRVRCCASQIKYNFHFLQLLNLVIVTQFNLHCTGDK